VHCYCRLRLAQHGPQLTPWATRQGAVIFSSSGPGSGADGGETFSYTGFNSGEYAKLYWGLNPVANVNEGTPNGNMIFLNYNPSTGMATWVSTSDWVFTSGFGGGGSATRPPVPYFACTTTASANCIGVGERSPTSSVWPCARYCASTPGSDQSRSQPFSIATMV
jgi:hypothetical protein